MGQLIKLRIIDELKSVFGLWVLNQKRQANFLKCHFSWLTFVNKNNAASRPVEWRAAVSGAACDPSILSRAPLACRFCGRPDIEAPRVCLCRCHFVSYARVTLRRKPWQCSILREVGRSGIKKKST